MELEQAIHYGGILLEKLERMQTHCGGAKIHDVKQYTGILSMSLSLAKMGVEELPDLLRCIESAETFLVESVRR